MGSEVNLLVEAPVYFKGKRIKEVMLNDYLQDRFADKWGHSMWARLRRALDVFFYARVLLETCIWLCVRFSGRMNHLCGIFFILALPVFKITFKSAVIAHWCRNRCYR